MNRWEYLNTAPYRVRQTIAAHFLAGCDTVVEIGAYRVPTPIAGIVAIDPLGVTPDAYHGSVGQWVAEHDWQPDGVVALGLDPEGGEDEIEAARKLIVGAQVSVIEVATGHAHAVDNLAWLLGKLRIVADIHLTLPDVEAEGFPIYNHRRLVVLEQP